jgi:hypothetical protein
MTIVATCPKGHELTLEERLAGKKVRCPRCKSVFQVPEMAEEAISEKPLRRRTRDDDDDDDDDRPRKRRAATYDDDDDEDDDDRPPRRRKAAVARRARDDDDDEEEEPKEDDGSDFIDDQERRREERRLKKKQLKLVDVGLLLHYIKLWMYVVGMILGMVSLVMFLIAGARAAGMAAEAAGRQIDAPDPGGGIVLFGFGLYLIFLFFFYLIVSAIAPLIGVVGSFLACFIPKKSYARGTIIMSLTFDLVAIVAWLLGLLAQVNVFGFDNPDKQLRMIQLMQLLSAFCQVAAWLTFLTYLRGLGAYLGEPGVGNEALNLIARLVIQVASLIADVLIVAACAFMLGGVNPFVAIGIGILVIIIWVIFFIFTFYLRLLKLVTAIRRAIDNKL